MDLLILIDGEFRSLIRNTIERLIGSNFKKDDDFNKEMIKKLSIRVVSSLITIQLFLLIQKYLPDMKKICINYNDNYFFKFINRKLILLNII